MCGDTNHLHRKRKNTRTLKNGQGLHPGSSPGLEHIFLPCQIMREVREGWNWAWAGWRRNMGGRAAIVAAARACPRVLSD